MFYELIHIGKNEEIKNKYGKYHYNLNVYKKKKQLDC